MLIIDYFSIPHVFFSRTITEKLWTVLKSKVCVAETFTDVITMGKNNRRHAAYLVIYGISVKDIYRWWLGWLWQSKGGRNTTYNLNEYYPDLGQQTNIVNNVFLADCYWLKLACAFRIQTWKMECEKMSMLHVAFDIPSHLIDILIHTMAWMISYYTLKLQIVFCGWISQFN